MKNFKNTIFYITVTGGFIAIMYWVVGQGKNLKQEEKWF